MPLRPPSVIASNPRRERRDAGSTPRPARPAAGGVGPLVAVLLALQAPLAIAAGDVACPALRIDRWVERVVPADCPPCWAGASPGGGTEGNTGTMARAANVPAIDWIAPAGGDAPMALAALPEARERLAVDPATPASGERVHRLPASPAIRLSVHSGPGWKGYVAVETTATRIGGRPLPRGAQAFVALTEQIAAGTEGTSIERTLVRSVVGPLPLDGLATKKARVDHVHALNVPETAKPERLGSVAWVQTPDGAVVAVAYGIPNGCPGAP